MKSFLILMATFLVSGAKASLPVIYFGNLEINSGALKTADGTLPTRGEQAIIRVFKRELAARVYDSTPSYQGGENAYGLLTHLFLRYKNQGTWEEILLKGAQYNARGPTFIWEPTEDVSITIPVDADFVEAWIKIDRVVPTGCYLSYDMTECPTLRQWTPAFLSNYGNNFKQSVR